MLFIKALNPMYFKYFVDVLMDNDYKNLLGETILYVSGFMIFCVFLFTEAIALVSGAYELFILNSTLLIIGYIFIILSCCLLKREIKVREIELL